MVRGVGECLRRTNVRGVLPLPRQPCAGCGRRERGHLNYSFLKRGPGLLCPLCLVVTARPVLFPPFVWDFQEAKRDAFSGSVDRTQFAAYIYLPPCRDPAKTHKLRAAQEPCRPSVFCCTSVRKRNCADFLLKQHVVTPTAANNETSHRTSLSYALNQSVGENLIVSPSRSCNRYIVRYIDAFLQYQLQMKNKSEYLPKRR